MDGRQVFHFVFRDEVDWHSGVEPRHKPPVKVEVFALLTHTDCRAYLVVTQRFEAKDSVIARFGS